MLGGLHMHRDLSQDTYAIILAIAQRGLCIVPVLVQRGDMSMAVQAYVQVLTQRGNALCSCVNI